MDRSLNSLSSDFRPKVVELLAQLTERGIAVRIVQTARTLEEHHANLTSGASTTALSKHLPRRLRGFPATDPDLDKVDAIDVCPYELYQLVGPDKLQWSDRASPQAQAAFAVIGEVGERLGLRWGGRWVRPHDPGHLELVLPAPPPPTMAA